MSQLYLAYSLPHRPPKKAKYALYWWNRVIFTKTKKEAERIQTELPYYQQEDSRIEKLI